MIYKNISQDDFVIATQDINGVYKNSVGLVNSLNEETAIIFFIGKNEVVRADINKIQKIDVDKTGKGYNKKICNICHILKNTSKFDKNQTDAKGRSTTRPSCKECRKNIDGLKITEQEKKRMDKIKPPKKTIFVCPICEKRTIVSITANLVKDHDHKTGKGRDWICDSCNTGLGRFKDDINFFEKIIQYLKKFPHK